MKKHLSKRIVSLMMALVLCLSLVVPAGAYEAQGSGTNVAFERVDDSLVPAAPGSDRLVADEGTADYNATDNLRVSIVLEDAPAIYAADNVMALAEDVQVSAYREYLEQTQDAVAAEISAETGKELDVVWNLTLAANIISANVQYQDIEAIEQIDGVEEVLIETRYEPAVAENNTLDPNMSTSSAQIGSDLAWASGYTGAGSKVAVIDTGTDTDHKSFDAGAFEYAIAEVEADGKSVDLMTTDDIASVLTKLNAYKRMGGNLTAEQLYLNAKLPYAFNYVDKGLDVTHDNDDQGEHGSHVAGISTANRYIADGNGGYTDALTSVHTQGVAPDAQLITMKVFGKGGGAYDSDYMAAIEDAILLGCDSINLSLGSGNPGMSRYSDSEYQQILDNLRNAGAVVSISAGNSGTWQENTLYGYLYNTDVSMQTDGSPGSYTNAFTVASIDNTGNTGNFLDFGGDNSVVSFSETSGYTNQPIASLDTNNSAGTEYDFILFDNTGKDGDGNNLLTDYADACAGKVVMVWRGTSSFYEKHNAAGEVGGIACIVMNNQAGTINMDLSDSTSTIPCVSITQADAQSIMAAATPVTDGEGNILYYTGKVIISSAIKAVQGDLDGYMTMSSFSSWGIPGSLEIKPEITAPGGNIYSVNGAVAGGEAYENMSGTSMAAPQIAGMAAVLAQYLREQGYTWNQQRAMTQSLLMSTATPVVEEDSGCYYSILNQGAGLANVNDAINAHSYIAMSDGVNAGAPDGKVKVELGDDPAKKGVYTFTYTLENLTDEPAYYTLGTDVFTQDVFAANSYSGVEVFLDTWTTMLSGATASYSVTNQPAQIAGRFTEADAQRVLEAASGEGAPLTADENTKYDIDLNGVANTYDAYLILNLIGEDRILLPAGGSVDVTVTIDVTGCNFTYYPNGAYIEAYTYAREVSTDEGVLGTTHSIPVLAYYGNWSAPSMYDVGTLAKYWYDAESSYPYLVNQTEFYTNYLTVKYAGLSGEYYFIGNPVADDVKYCPERNAFNNEHDTLSKYVVSVIRNAGNAMWQVTDAESGKLYYRSDDLGTVYSAYYYSNGSAWRQTQSNVSLGWDGTDASGNKLPEGTSVNVSLVLAPEYYADANGNYNWDVLTNGVLGDGAYMTTYMTIDNTAPELLSLSYDAEEGKLYYSAKDNQYLAAVTICQVDSEYESVVTVPDATAPGQVHENWVGDIDEETLKDGGNFYIQFTDYAMNTSTYKFVLTADGMDRETKAPTSITLADASLVKGTKIQLKPQFEPYLADTGVIWTSANEEIATVDANGYVTGVSAGEVTITATSTAAPDISGSCTVTVKTYDVTLNGMLQDVNGNPLLFTWDLANDKTWTEYAELENNINAATYGWDIVEQVEGVNTYSDDVAYQMNASGYLYKVDLKTGETKEGSDAAVAFGAPVDDMEYAYISSRLFGQNILFGVYGSYLLYSAPAEGNTFSYGWNLASYLSYYTGSSEFTAIAYGGYTKNSAGNDVDVFYCLTDNGYLWYMTPDLQVGSTGLSWLETDLDLDFPGYDGAYYCSMVLGDDGNLYLSYFNGNTNEIYVLEPEYDYDEEYKETYIASYTATLLGDIGDAVWPCALLSVVPNGAAGNGGTTEAAISPKLLLTTAASDRIGGGDEVAPVTPDPVESTPVEPTPEINADDAEPVETANPVGELNAVSVAGGELDKPSIKLHGSNNTTLTVKIEADASTNGLLWIDYNEEFLTLESVTAMNGLLTSSNDADGVLAVAYASASAKTGTAITATFSYNALSSPYFTNMTITTLEEGNDFTPRTETVQYQIRSLISDYVPALPSTPDTPTDPTEPDDGESIISMSFSDVPASHPFYADIRYVVENGLMNGVSADSFQPAATTTRGMIATILYRMENAPATAGASAFADIANGMYYTDAVAWAAANGIVKGYEDNTFRPDAEITREQMATILFRYAQYKGVDVSVGEDTNVLSYSDIASVSEYAVSAFQWACGAQIINGTSADTLSPALSATRGQVSAILHRYCEWLG